MTVPETTDLAPRRGTTEIAAGPAEWSVEQIIAQTKKIQQCMTAVMKEGEHYGVIPGTQGRDGKPPKPTLLKAGAEKLCLMFRFDPEYETIKAVETTELFSYTIRCVLFHIPTGTRVASGLGACNSREEKYLRAAPKRCPACQKETIFKSKDENRGYYCWSKKGGCGKNYDSDDERALIDQQESGIKDPSDLANTILKMACKRALVAAVLNGTAASDCFTQDLEDLEHRNPSPATPGSPEYTPPPDKKAAPRANTVKSTGKLASREQVDELLSLRSKVGGLVVCGPPERCASGGKRWGEKRCGYHIQLAAFKDASGNPVQDADKLSPEQITNLIGRYKDKIAMQSSRAAQPVDIEATVIPDSSDIRSRLAADADSDKTFEDIEGEICSIFGVDKITDINDVQDRKTALQLVMAHSQGREAFEKALEEARS